MLKDPKEYGNTPSSENIVSNNCSGPRELGSLRLDIGELDHLCPLLSIFGDEFFEVCGRAWQYDRAEVGKALFDRDVSETCIDFPI